MKLVVRNILIQLHMFFPILFFRLLTPAPFFSLRGKCVHHLKISDLETNLESTLTFISILISLWMQIFNCKAQGANKILYKEYFQIEGYI